MFKRIMYIISALIVLAVLSFLIYLKFIRSNTKGEEKIVTQTIIPIVSSQIDNKDKKNENYNKYNDHFSFFTY